MQAMNIMNMDKMLQQLTSSIRFAMACLLYHVVT